MPFASVALLLVAACCRDTHPPPPPPEEKALTEEIVTENNRGVALMLQFDYDAAFRVFSSLATDHPELQDLQVNTAISQLNRQQAGDSEAALSRLEAVLENDPENLRAAYCAGLLLLYRGDADVANAKFQRVVDASGDDAYAAYWLGQCQAEQQQYEEALKWYQKAAQLDPYLRSAYYGSFVALRQLGRAEEAKAQLEDYERLKHNLLGRLAEFKYTRMGAKGEAIALEVTRSEPVTVPEGSVFEDGKPLVIVGVGQESWQSEDVPRNASCADINGDGELDFFVTGLSGDDGMHNAVCIQGDGEFRLAEEHPLNGVANVNAALWGDFDNDGFVDVYLARRGPNQLWRQTEESWEDVTESTQTSAGDFNTTDGAMYDADHDGDLDLLLVNDDGPIELLNNNRDGSFRPLAEELGLSSERGQSLVVADFDGDRDLDILLVKSQTPHDVWINNRAWNYDAGGDAWEALRNTPINVAVAGDIDGDGRVEIVYANRSQLGQFSRDDAGVWKQHAIEGAKRPEVVQQLAIEDVDGDGALDIVAASSSGWSIIPTKEVSRATLSYSAPNLAFLALAPLQSDRGASAIALVKDSQPLLWSPGSGRFKFAQLKFVGRENDADQLRSNASGVGIQAAARIDSMTTSFIGVRAHSGPGQGLLPLRIGLAGRDSADYVKVLWPDGVLQTEIAVDAGARTVTETQRQLSSCPVLFCHNGEQFVFVTDLLGVGGMGFAVGRNEYAPSRPRESVLLPAGVLAWNEGHCRLKLTEPMEEACYLDHVALVAHDLPPGWRMTVDERMNIAGPPATGEVVYFRHQLFPQSATNDRDENVFPALQDVDQIAAPPGKRDSRFLGRTEKHTVTLSFKLALDEISDARLLAHGWVEYPYSQTMFAAWQAGVTYDAPTVEARGEDGQWKIILEQFGYPAGMPREMSVPLRDLPPGCRELRISTNQEIYWDQLSVIAAEDCPKAFVQRLKLEQATLGDCGFPRWTFGPQRVPKFEWTMRTPLWDTRHQAGAYTRFGPVERLVEQTDDALAIFGPGEEIDVQFRAPPAELVDQWSRRFVLKTTGWCKDMDLYTKDGDTVGPLPIQYENAPEAKTRRDMLHRQFNTRYRSGH